ncbi:hypothetical protein ABID21_003909 [Pseudorhizobium tarimense]|uniref:HARP domain-containing protein n=1 Tax=Pseudorhizobium tarimense TaxID=1079109 RepID=A0ABV2HB47_9HYPH|nr:hypothetical protein [Pseudorhizobium tarimense]MCJ8520689.1 hypothetical protein [Pseudorhizobium tarimense]
MRNGDPRDKEKSTPETVSFPFDRMTVARFRETFPRARWSDQLQAWTVPGTTARRRIDLWLAAEADRRRPFEEERGRDAFEFEPILSPYLSVHERGFRIKTPFSRKVVEELRQIPFTRWNGEEKVWEVPYASYDDLQHRWQTIEEAARWCEPEERRKRAEARKGTEEEAKARRRALERRKRRLPVAGDDLPPLDRPLATASYGVVVFTEVTGELMDREEVAGAYPHAEEEHVWANWRLPTFEELINTWPARSGPGEEERHRGWWRASLEELRAARQKARPHEKRSR